MWTVTSEKWSYTAGSLHG